MSTATTDLSILRGFISDACRALNSPARTKAKLLDHLDALERAISKKQPQPPPASAHQCEEECCLPK